MQIYVGNLPPDFSADQLKELFSRHGTVDDAYLVFDKEEKKPRGFGFVFMSDANAVRLAIRAMNGYKLGDKRLTVTLSRKKGQAPARPMRRGSNRHGRFQSRPRPTRD